MRDAILRLAGTLFILSAVGLHSACARGIVVAGPAPAKTVVVAKGRSSPRSLRVPPGHYPPAGKCRLWYSGRPPGHQPKPVSCSRLRGHVPRGAFVLYNGSAWDTDYDWRVRERKSRGSVPRVILDLTVVLWS